MGQGHTDRLASTEPALNGETQGRNAHALSGKRVKDFARAMFGDWLARRVGH